MNCTCSKSKYKHTGKKVARLQTLLKLSCDSSWENIHKIISAKYSLSQPTHPNILAAYMHTPVFNSAGIHLNPLQVGINCRQRVEFRPYKIVKIQIFTAIFGFSAKNVSKWVQTSLLLVM